VFVHNDKHKTIASYTTYCTALYCTIQYCTVQYSVLLVQSLLCQLDPVGRTQGQDVVIEVVPAQVKIKKTQK